MKCHRLTCKSCRNSNYVQNLSKLSFRYRLNAFTAKTNAYQNFPQYIKRSKEVERFTNRLEIVKYFALPSDGKSKDAVVHNIPIA